MKTKTQQELVCDALVNSGAVPQGKPDTKLLHISSKIIRCDDFLDIPSVFVVPERFDVRDGVVDGVHWALNKVGSSDAVRVFVPDSTTEPERQALATLAACSSQITVKLGTYVIQNGKVVTHPVGWSVPQFPSTGRLRLWAHELEHRKDLSLPRIGQQLSDALKGPVPSFRWYRNVTSRSWSGRVAGWQVCSLKDKGQVIEHSLVTETQSRITAVSGQDWQHMLKAIVEFNDRRRLPTRKGEPKRKHWPGDIKQEHLLESGVWRGSDVVRITPKVASGPLQPIVELPLQMPALYSNIEGKRGKRGAPARFVDAVMKDGTTPWALELKVATGGQGQYYRHAITQAVLYREFLRKATDLCTWFRSLSLVPEDFRAAIVFPKLKLITRCPDKLRTDLKKTAGCFDVEVVELGNDWEDLQRRCMK